MRLRHAIAAAGLTAIFGSARADPPLIPPNYVDDFGVSHSSEVAAPAAPHATGEPMIPSNYVDDFGALAPRADTAPPRAPPAGYASLVPSNYVDDFGVAPGRPAERPAAGSVARAGAGERSARPAQRGTRSSLHDERSAK